MHGLLAPNVYDVNINVDGVNISLYVRWVATRPARIKKAYHHGNLREDLVTAALEIITRHGAAALTLRSVAKRLGVSQTAPYRHFSSKETLLAAVANQGFAALLSRFREGIEAAGTRPLDRFRSISITYAAFALEHPAHFAVMYDAHTEDFNRPVNARTVVIGQAALDVYVAIERRRTVREMVNTSPRVVGTMRTAVGGRREHTMAPRAGHRCEIGVLR